MTVTPSQPAAGVQELIDCRLDTLDRLLLGRAARADRVAIVGEVEAQIHHLLGQRGPGEPTREDVLAVLARLDPPEAYLPPRDADADPWAAHAARVTAFQAAPPVRPRRGLARLAGVLGLVALVMLVVLFPLVWLTAAATDSYVLGIAGGAGVLLLTMATAIPAVVLGVMARRGSGWAVAGLVCGIVALVLTVVVAAPLTVCFL